MKEFYNITEDRRVLLGLSGGIDSEYSARLLLNEGFDVHGMYINMLNKDTTGVKAVAEKLGIPLCVENMSADFEKYVVLPFAEYYKSGKTPNPCVECNRYVKINSLVEESEKQGIPYVATGHYAKKVSLNGRYAVSKAKDVKKDQSYFLWKLTQNQIKRLIFPLGDVIKETVLMSGNSGYKESQDICFIDDDYRTFLESIGVSSPRGRFIDTLGNTVGEHLGIHNYTRGQRKGLGVALGYPAFITKIDHMKNEIVLGKRDELKIHSFKIKDINFQGAEPFDGEKIYDVKTRYRACFKKASVKFEGKTATVFLEEHDELVTPGQSAVFYDGDVLMFGGEIIEEGMK